MRAPPAALRAPSSTSPYSPPFPTSHPPTFVVQLKPLAISEHPSTIDMADGGMDRGKGGECEHHKRRGSGALAPLPWGKATPGRLGSQSTPPRPLVAAPTNSPPRIWMPPAAAAAAAAAATTLPSLVLTGAVHTPKATSPLPERSIFCIAAANPQIEAPRSGSSGGGNISGGDGGGSGGNGGGGGGGDSAVLGTPATAGMVAGGRAAGGAWKGSGGTAVTGADCRLISPPLHRPGFTRSMSMDSGVVQPKAAAERPTLAQPGGGARKRSTEHLYGLQGGAMAGSSQRYRLGEDMGQGGTPTQDERGGATHGGGGSNWSPADLVQSPQGGSRRLNCSPLSRFRALAPLSTSMSKSRPASLGPGGGGVSGGGGGACAMETE